MHKFNFGIRNTTNTRVKCETQNTTNVCASSHKPFFSYNFDACGTESAENVTNECDTGGFVCLFLLNA